MKKNYSVVLLAVLLAACGRSPDTASPAAGKPAEASAPAAGGDRASRPQAVTTVVARVESVPVVLSAQGNVLPLDEVDIRPQKTGVVGTIHFSEGQEVARGQLLFSLDDREDRANVQKAEATLEGTRAQLVIAERELERNQDLFNQKFVSSAVLDSSRNKLETLRSQLAQNQAALEQVRAVLSYSKIHAPFAGRAGRIDVRPGSLVTANSTTALVKITRMDPIGVSFTLPERDLAGLRAAQTRGAVKVEVDLPAQASGGTLRGQVVFLESAVDKVSGTIGVKAQVENPGRKLWPGQYVTVRVSAGVIADALVLPPQAVINGPNNRFVYAVKADQTVEPRPVDLVRIAGRNAVVTGIEPGVKVVLEGAANLRPGSKVFESGNGGGGRNREGGSRRAEGGASAPLATAEPSPAGERRRDAAAAEAPTRAAQAAGGEGGFKAPEGFVPRDPERWATMTDEQKAAAVARWRERRAAGGAQ